MTQALSRPKLAYLGRLSYGTYLWHWPVIVVLTHELSLGHLGVFAVTCVVATALAAASYHVLELRVRFSPWLDGFPKPVIAAGLALSLIGGLVLVPAILHTDSGAAARSLDWRAAQKRHPSAARLLAGERGRLHDRPRIRPRAIHAAAGRMMPVQCQSCPEDNQDHDRQKKFVDGPFYHFPLCLEPELDRRQASPFEEALHGHGQAD